MLPLHFTDADIFPARWKYLSYPVLSYPILFYPILLVILAISSDFRFSVLRVKVKLS